jgi:glycine betaine/proline transport system ATP-binding protein
MQQRVGLARALANDPEILLMDEAFSALDPLIRAEMQDELIELQTRLHKTIVFITHDLDEALKLGDRITILGTGGKVIQIGTSEEIVSNPADDYVRAFVQNVDRTKVITASAVMRRPLTVTMPKDGPAVAVRRMNREGFSTAFVVDTDRKLKGIVRIDDAVKLEKKGEKSFGNVIDDNVSITAPETPIGDLLGTALTNKYPICVVDDTGTLLGIVERPSIIAEVGGDEEPTLLSESEFT